MMGFHPSKLMDNPVFAKQSKKYIYYVAESDLHNKYLSHLFLYETVNFKPWEVNIPEPQSDLSINYPFVHS